MPSSGWRHHDRLFYATVLGGVTQEMPAFREEIFGPVAPVTVVKDDSEAIAVANDTEYGLVAAIQTGSRDRGRAVADHLDTGIVHVNDQTRNKDAYAPFGGTGASATARALARRAAGTSSRSGAGDDPRSGTRVPVLSNGVDPRHRLASVWHSASCGRGLSCLTGGWLWRGSGGLRRNRW